MNSAKATVRCFACVAASSVMASPMTRAWFVVPTARCSASAPSFARSTSSFRHGYGHLDQQVDFGSVQRFAGNDGIRPFHQLGVVLAEIAGRIFGRVIEHPLEGAVSDLVGVVHQTGLPELKVPSGDALCEAGGPALEEGS